MTESKKQRYRNTPRGKYNTQKVHARQRGIEFLLSFDEWHGIWRNSRKWPMRGSLPHQYVMCRRGDEGPYAVGNVYIALARHNMHGAGVKGAMRRTHGANFKEVTF